MDAERGWTIVREQRLAIADRLASLTPQQWEAPSLCAGWRVRDVGAHLAIVATWTLPEIAGGVLRSRGRFDAMIDDLTRRRGRRSPERIVADLRQIAGSRRLVPGLTWRDPLLDSQVHRGDIVLALGEELDVPIDGAREAADHAWARPTPFRAAERLAGLRLVAEDTDWTRGSGAELRGPISSLLMVSTGRHSVRTGLSGPGLAVLQKISGSA